jgi:hypothetical protein
LKPMFDGLLYHRSDECITNSNFSWCMSALAFIISWLDTVLASWMSIRETRVPRRISNF